MLSVKKVFSFIWGSIDKILSVVGIVIVFRFLNSYLKSRAVKKSVKRSEHDALEHQESVSADEASWVEDGKRTDKEKESD